MTEIELLRERFEECSRRYAGLKSIVVQVYKWDYEDFCGYWDGNDNKPKQIVYPAENYIDGNNNEGVFVSFWLWKPNWCRWSTDEAIGQLGDLTRRSVSYFRRHNELLQVVPSPARSLASNFYHETDSICSCYTYNDLIPWSLYVSAIRNEKTTDEDLSCWLDSTATISYVKSLTDIDIDEEILRLVGSSLPMESKDHIIYVSNDVFADSLLLCENALRSLGSCDSHDNSEDPVTLSEFIKKYCQECRTDKVANARKYLVTANSRGQIKLPEPLNPVIKQGQPYKYDANRLKKCWPDFKSSITFLPNLK